MSTTIKKRTMLKVRYEKDVAHFKKKVHISLLLQKKD